MSTTTQQRTPSVPARRLGYTVAAVVNTTLLLLINGRLGWDVLPFLTADFTSVLPFVNASLAAGVIVNLACVVHDPRWFVALGSVVTTAIGTAALVQIWQVFPIDLGDEPFAWTVLVRTVLIVGIVGSAIGIVVQVVSLLRAVGGDGR